MAAKLAKLVHHLNGVLVAIYIYIQFKEKPFLALTLFIKRVKAPV